mmetsp:Transcript_25574/g.78661  ORF Transcript_25574/g.78661 Transcript_25574/m.78661 type:complete len:349 (+) Transcript_25574:58-1104(+)
MDAPPLLRERRSVREAPPRRDAIERELLGLPRRLDMFLRDEMPRRRDDVSSSRKERSALALELIVSGSALVNGSAVTNVDALVYPLEDKVEVLAGEVRTRVVVTPRRSRVWALHKEKRTITDMGPGEKLRDAATKFEGVDAGDPPMPIGQLDIDTTGLLLFTDDGDLSMLINLPGNVPKMYYVQCDAREDLDIAKRLETLSHEDAVWDIRHIGKSKLDEPKRPVLCVPKCRFHLAITVGVGSFHIVKRLFFKIGLSVRQLRRDAVGPLSLADLGIERRAGLFCSLTPRQVNLLWEAAGGRRRLLRFKLDRLYDRQLANAAKGDSGSDPRLDCFLRDACRRDSSSLWAQ